MSSFLLLAFYAAVLHLVPFLYLMGYLPGRTFVLIDSATIIPAVLGIRYLGSNRKLSRLDFAVLAYLGLSLLSIVLYFKEDNPSDPYAYVYGVHLFVLPMFFYFAVKLLNANAQRHLVVVLLLLNLFGLVFGIYLHFTRPAFYTAYLQDTFAIKGYSESWQFYDRLQSYFGSTTIGTICASSIVLLGLYRCGFVLTGVLLPILLLSAALSKQRGGIVACGMALFYLLIVNRQNIVWRIGAGLLSIPLLLYGLDFFDSEYSGTKDQIYERSTTDLLVAWQERGYRRGFEYFLDYPFGVGLGGTSSAADSAGLAGRGQVVDANFMRILADLGIEGLLIFLIVLACAVGSSWRREERFGWITLIGIFCFISLGTNILDNHYVSHCFWLFLGMLDSARGPGRDEKTKNSRIVTKRNGVVPHRGSPSGVKGAVGESQWAQPFAR